MSAYTNVAKPTGTPYTLIGKIPYYDQSNITYDSASTYYDGFSNTVYTSVNKPTGSSYTNVTKPTT